MGSTFFDAGVIGRLKALRLRWDRARAGDPAAGMRSAPGGGRFEFRDHRAYAAGDDFRTIDWNLFGRLDQLFVKRFEGETGMEVRVVLDRSRSMGDPAKDAQARRIAAAAAFACAGLGRRVAIDLLDEKLRRAGTIVRDAGQAEGLLPALEAIGAASGRFDPAPLAPLLAGGREPRLVILVSDFFDEPSPVPALAARRGARVNVVFGALSTAEERRPSPARRLSLRGLEDEGRLELAADQVLVENYCRAFAEAREEARRGAQAHRAGFVEVAAEEAFEAAFLRIAQEGGLGR